MTQIEEYLGMTLFQRRRFKRTPQGEKLFASLSYFSGLDSEATEIQGDEAHQIRLGASDILLRDYFPESLGAVWRGKLTPQLENFLGEVCLRVGKLLL